MSKDKIMGINEKTPFKNYICLDDLQYFMSNLEGKLLTIIDASISEREQNKAVKSLIRNTSWNQFDTVRQWYYKQDDNGKTPFPFGPIVNTDIR